MSPAAERPGSFSELNVRPDYEEFVAPRTPTPTLSVTVLNYNYGRYLAECLDSILAQTFRDFEVIVIDDSSTDGSLEVVRPYLADPRVRLVAHEENRGFVSSLIEGTERWSRGEFVSVISADDLASETLAFKQQLDLMQRHPSVAFCFTGRCRFHAQSGGRASAEESFTGDIVIDGAKAVRLLITDKNVQVLHSGTIIRRSAYFAAGGYDPRFRYTVDFALWPLLAMEGDVGYKSGALYGYRMHSSQMSHSKGAESRLIEESLEAVANVCARMAGDESPSLLRDATKYTLFAVALDDAFNDRRRLALKRCLTAVRLRPRVALASRDLAAVVGRVCLGERGLALVGSALNRGRGRKGHQSAFERRGR